VRGLLEREAGLLKVDHAVEKVILAGDVTVQRHRLDPTASLSLRIESVPIPYSSAKADVRAAIWSPAARDSRLAAAAVRSVCRSGSRASLALLPLRA